jgi:hypothetical protein
MLNACVIGIYMFTAKKKNETRRRKGESPFSRQSTNIEIEKERKIRETIALYKRKFPSPF